ncbi:hypothetical protein QAD02_013536 [Eretmocerus hayati]|uniref:Uncharacterized protein n=1 Tax=Eretmocerus hayati TaxID=131215 RepID=A0ACC2P5E1_9HYME|nr:hypothetical protein QAD02_013536 [Eretmocerus hayati]
MMVRAVVQPTSEDISPCTTPPGEYVLQNSGPSQIDHSYTQSDPMPSFPLTTLPTSSISVSSPTNVYNEPLLEHQYSTLIESGTIQDISENVKGFFATRRMNAATKTMETIQNFNTNNENLCTNPVPSTSNMCNTWLIPSTSQQAPSEIKTTQNKSLSTASTANSTQFSPKKAIIKRKHRTTTKNKRSKNKKIADLKQKLVNALNDPSTDFPVEAFNPIHPEPIDPFKSWNFRENLKFLTSLLLALKGQLEVIPYHVKHLKVTAYVKPDKSNWRCLYCAIDEKTSLGWDLIFLHVIGLAGNFQLKPCPGCHKVVQPKATIVGCSTCRCIWSLHESDIQKGVNFNSINLPKPRPAATSQNNV